jgi:hypothetical protein
MYSCQFKGPEFRKCDKTRKPISNVLRTRPIGNSANYCAVSSEIMNQDSVFEIRHTDSSVMSSADQQYLLILLSEAFEIFRESLLSARNKPLEPALKIDSSE